MMIEDRVQTGVEEICDNEIEGVDWSKWNPETSNESIQNYFFEDGVDTNRRIMQAFLIEKWGL